MAWSWRGRGVVVAWSWRCRGVVVAWSWRGRGVVVAAPSGRRDGRGVGACRALGSVGQMKSSRRAALAACPSGASRGRACGRALRVVFRRVVRNASGSDFRAEKGCQSTCPLFCHCAQAALQLGRLRALGSSRTPPFRAGMAPPDPTVSLYFSSSLQILRLTDQKKVQNSSKADRGANVSSQAFPHILRVGMFVLAMGTAWTKHLQEQRVALGRGMRVAPGGG